MSFLWNWVWDLLYSLGLWKKKATILLLGLDNAGKTTLLHKVKYGTVRLFIPTVRASLEEVVVGNVQFRAWDLGGHQQVRSSWKDYFVEADAILFVVDAADHARLPEAKEELQVLLHDPALAEVKAFVVLGNKTDLQSALSREQLIAALGLDTIALGKVHDERPPVQVFRCSLVDGTGYVEAFNWLSGVL